MKLGNFLSRYRTVQVHGIWYEKGRTKRRCIDIRGDRNASSIYGWSFNKMELIFISYMNNDRNKVGCPSRFH